MQQLKHGFPVKEKNFQRLSRSYPLLLSPASLICGGVPLSLPGRMCGGGLLSLSLPLPGPRGGGGGDLSRSLSLSPRSLLGGGGDLETDLILLSPPRVYEGDLRLLIGGGESRREGPSGLVSMA